MSYTIYNTDGTVLLTLADGKVDQKTTSLSLIGKNVNSYGEYYNNNLIKLLENFAGTDEPRSPVTGQLWYDTSSGRLKIYDLNNRFRPITNAIASDQIPVELANNDFWFDTVNQLMYFTTDGTTLYPVGITDSVTYGTTGWVAEKIQDNFSNYRTVTSLYNAGTRIGILSAEAFTLLNSTSSISSVQVGLNLNTSIPGIRFAGTATSADAIAGVNVGDLLYNNINQVVNGNFIVRSNLGFTVYNDVNQGLTLFANSTTEVASIASNASDIDLALLVNNSTVGLTASIYVNALPRKLGIWNTNPQYQLDIYGDTRVQGNLYVEGNTTYIESTQLQTVDPNLELGYGGTDATVNNGGLTLKGTTNHKFTWSNNGSGWNANDNLNLISDPVIYSGITPISSTGTDATFNITKEDGVYTVEVVNSGTLYDSTTTLDANLLTVYGSTLGGVTPNNNLYITVLTTSTNGTISSFSYNGTATTYAFKISSSTVITKTSLGQGITSAPGLIHVGNLNYLTVTNVYITGNSVGTTGTDQTLYLTPTGSGTIDVGGKKITSLSTCTDGGDAANKKYVDDQLTVVTSKNFALTLDTTNFVSNYGSIHDGIKTFLDLIYPITNVGEPEFDLPDGVRAKILCGSYTVPVNTQTVSITAASLLVNQGPWTNTATVASGLVGAIVGSLPAVNLIPSVTYETQTWKVILGVWTYMSSP
jgi:hypothetical protein